MVPILTVRRKHHDLRLENRRIVERTHINADHVRLVLRLVVKRRTAFGAEAFALLSAAVGGSQIFACLANKAQRGTRKHRHRRMSRARIPLTVATLAVESANGFSRDLVAHCATSTASGVDRHGTPRSLI